MLHTIEEEIENLVECNMSQTCQEEIYISLTDACILNKEHDVDKHRNDSLETQNLVKKHHIDDMLKSVELREE